MSKFLILAASGALLATGATAQTAQTASPAAKAAPTTSGSTSNESARQQIMKDMQQAGFTNVHVQPDSFLVHAKEKSGTPVTMLIDPDTVAEVIDTSGKPAQPGASNVAGDFTTIPAADMLTTKVVGTNVYNNANQDIGTIKDVATMGGSVKAYIVGVGGFLGMGDHYVAVNPTALKMTYDANAKAWHANMNTTADQLKAAPEFKYPT